MRGVCMRRYIYLNVSRSVTKEQWERTYEETLKLVRAFPLAEKKTVRIHGIDTVCLVPTEEKREGGDGGGQWVGWETIGDYKYMQTAENYYLPRNIVEDEGIEPNAGDAILGAFPAYLNYDWQDSRFQHVYECWGGKTLGKNYHIYLLAIGCLIEDRLGDAAFVYGNITYEQCRRAVQLANEYFEEPIKIPVCCDLGRLRQRILRLPVSEMEKQQAIEQFYLGNKDNFYEKEEKKQGVPRNITEEWEICDINNYEDLLFYEKSDSMHSQIRKTIGNLQEMCKPVLDEKRYTELMKRNAQSRCRWLVEKNHSILLRDKDWEKIFRNIEKDASSFARYYFLSRVKRTNDNLTCMVRAFMINDNLYEDYMELVTT